MELSVFLIVCPFVFLAGLLDSIAGGGGLISLTAYLAAGVPAHSALGTNKLSSAIGTLVATIRMARNGYIPYKPALIAVISALVGSALGAQLALLTPEHIFQILLALALPPVAFFVLRKRSINDDSSSYTLYDLRTLTIIAGISFVIGGYDGFYGPGTGTFMLLALTMLAHIGVQSSSGLVKAANLASNIAALVTFFAHGHVLILLGLTASLFSIAGNYIGAGLVIKWGTRIVRPIITVALVLLFCKVVFDLVV